MSADEAAPARPPIEPPQTLVAIAVAVGYYFVVGLTVALFATALHFLRQVPGVALWFGWTAPVLIAVAAALMIACLVYITIILWAALPRWSRARTDGVLIARSAQPALWELIDDVSGLAGHRAPRQLRVTLRYELTCADRGGAFGWLVSPELRIGLPLLHLHNEAEVRALLAHELGHLAAADRSPLIRLVLRVREPLRRSVGLSSNPAVGFVLLPLSLIHLYASFAIRVLNGLVWSQDFAADRFVSRSERLEALVAGVRFSAECGAAWSGFLDDCIWPMVQLRFLPPILAGLDRYLESPIAVEAAERRAHESRSRQPHEVIVESAPDIWRVKALGDEPAVRDSASSLASARLVELAALEQAILYAHLPLAPALQPIAWHEAVERVYLPLWRRGCDANAELLAKHTPYTVVEAVRKILTTSSNVVIPNESQPWLRDPVPFVRWLLGAAICLASVRIGCQVTAWPGEPVRITRDGRDFAPFDSLLELEQGKLSREEWWRRCAAVGILDTSLEPGRSGAAVAA